MILTLNSSKTKITGSANSVGTDVEAHNKPPHLDIPGLPSSVSMLSKIRLN